MAIYIISLQKAVASPQANSKKLENIIHIVNAIHKTKKLQYSKKQT